MGTCPFCQQKPTKRFRNRQSALVSTFAHWCDVLNTKTREQHLNPLVCRHVIYLLGIKFFSNFRLIWSVSRCLTKAGFSQKKRCFKRFYEINVIKTSNRNLSIVSLLSFKNWSKNNPTRFRNWRCVQFPRTDFLKRFSDWIDCVTFAEANCLNTDMSKSSRSDENRSRPVDYSKAYNILRAFNCQTWLIHKFPRLCWNWSIIKRNTLVLSATHVLRSCCH